MWISSKNRVAIVGGGIIGLSVALELQSRGIPVRVLERAPKGTRMVGQASWAAAGMLAAEDPHNPLELQELSCWSESLYDGFLGRVAERSGMAVPYQTFRTRQFGADGSSVLLAERSVDPRQVAVALEAAVGADGGTVRRGVEVAAVEESGEGVRLQTSEGEIEAEQVVWANGSWCGRVAGMKPRKGQMLRVALPEGVAGDVVYRAEDVYVVPRTQGPQAGTALIGATVEDCGFDVQVEPEALARLRARAAEMLPEVADERRAPLVEAWVGFRPAVPGGLPVIDRLPGSARQVVATGHFRNGILLAPATAVVVADLLEGKPSGVDVSQFRIREGNFGQDGR